jgi:prepilin-type N-terminal cleavage/methylation domain-containing protein
MKLTNTHNTKRKSGMTLLELTVVILVLLSLISILFIGARAWKKGSDRSANIMNIRNVQQAARGHENMYNLAVAAPLPNASIVSTNGTTGYLKTPTPPANLPAYTYADVVTPVGTLYTANNALVPEYGFAANTEYADW